MYPSMYAFKSVCNYQCVRACMALCVFMYASLACSKTALFSGVYGTESASDRCITVIGAI